MGRGLLLKSAAEAGTWLLRAGGSPSARAPAGPEAVQRDGTAGKALERLLSAWPAEEFPPDMLQRLVRSAPRLSCGDSTGGHDPHDVLSAPQREALDLAAGVYRARLNRETGEPGLDLPPGYDR
jgi:hypothetical protein